MPTTLAVLRQQQSASGPYTLINSGGSAALSLASVTNGSYRQSGVLDFSSVFGRVLSIRCSFEFATAPTAGNTIDIWGNPSPDGTTHLGGCSGSDGSYTGLSSNAADSVQHLEPIGSHRCSALATSNVQLSIIRRIWRPIFRYYTFVVLNGSGVTFHSTAANLWIKFSIAEDLLQDS